MAEIARSYGCTSPAIRYIIHRTERGEINRDDRESAVAPLRGDGARPTVQVVSVETRAHAGRRSGEEVWDRLNSDIASLLAGMDAIAMNDSDENYEALLLATDRLLRSSARTRLEIERVLESRKIGTRRRAR